MQVTSEEERLRTVRCELAVIVLRFESDHAPLTPHGVDDLQRIEEYVSRIKKSAFKGLESKREEGK
jgi:hypothetical protein